MTLRRPWATYLFAELLCAIYIRQDLEVTKENRELFDQINRMSGLILFVGICIIQISFPIVCISKLIWNKTYIAFVGVVSC